MEWGPTSQRSDQYFWEKLGLDMNAASDAVRCFPEFYHHPYQERAVFRNGDMMCTRPCETYAADWIKTAIERHGGNARHPAFWLAQGYDLEEAAARAVAANAMVRLQLEATQTPPKPDRFAEIAQALLMQNALLQQAREHDVYFDRYDDVPRLPAPSEPQQAPFDPNDYPRFRAR